MTMPGFTADSSLYRSRRTYRGTAGGARPGPAAVLPQQFEPEAPGTCCGKHCPSLCGCAHGVGYCIGPHVVEPETVLPDPVFRASGSNPGGEICHADQPVYDIHGHATQAWVYGCPCGCWASTHDAGCWPCP